MQHLFNLYLKRCIGIAKTSCPDVPQGAQSNQHCSPHRGGWKGHLSWRMKPGSLFGLQPLETPAFPKPLPQATPWLPPKHLRSSYSEMWVKLALGKKGRSQPIHFSKINMASVGLNEPGRPPALSMTNGATSEAKPIWARITWPAHTAYTHTHDIVHIDADIRHMYVYVCCKYVIYTLQIENTCAYMLYNCTIYIYGSIYIYGYIYICIYHQKVLEFQILLESLISARFVI